MEPLLREHADWWPAACPADQPWAAVLAFWAQAELDHSRAWFPRQWAAQPSDHERLSASHAAYGIDADVMGVLWQQDLTRVAALVRDWPSESVGARLNRIDRLRSLDGHEAQWSPSRTALALAYRTAPTAGSAGPTGAACPATAVEYRTQLERLVFGPEWPPVEGPLEGGVDDACHNELFARYAPAVVFFLDEHPTATPTTAAEKWIACWLVVVGRRPSPALHTWASSDPVGPDRVDGPVRQVLARHIEQKKINIEALG
jgi:hypothetical protein